ncbi:TetR family transcriptional regulator [Pantoea alhagi]|uniref:TetR family transcriptional regulator n=1 Tax=Pantoea alhagi TaxID=1891675 RepID=A0A1W6BA57_9GAMM|nr:TetR/AcrR family transcriptional regulator [Pantoea alhagi]ARJ43947.1 TetR family transcriptional regulator [Pantoea alhagi]
MNQAPRQRMTHQARRQQLLTVAWDLIRQEGTDALTLGRVAEEAGVSKPVVYDHFSTRHGLLAALYEDFDIRQNALFDAAMAAAGDRLQDKAAVVAASYVNCVLTQGREIPDVLSALDSTPELAEVKRQYQLDFIEKFRGWFAAFVAPSGIPLATMWGLLGAADAISSAVICGDISQQEGLQELTALIITTIERSR